MARTIQIRNIPDKMHRKLKVRAEQDGRSLSNYLLHELRMIAERPTMEEMLKRLHQREPVILPMCAAQTIREERAKRIRHLDRVLARR